MDENKLKMLKSMDYKIHPCCGLCANGLFRNPNSPWGECTEFEYEHLKHTDTNRNVSIHEYGVCPLFVPTIGVEIHLGAFEEFFHDDV